MSDRGMMKWNAFNALLAHGTNVQKMMVERTKIPKPILSYDQLEELNEIITLAILDNRNIEVNFYHNGYVLSYEGIIKKVDMYTRELIFSDKRIKLGNVLKVKLK